jgi:hypothetical protein
MRDGDDADVVFLPEVANTEKEVEEIISTFE